MNSQIKSYKLMIVQTNEQYARPQCEVLDVQPEGVIALSPGKYPTWEEENL